MHVLAVEYPGYGARGLQETRWDLGPKIQVVLLLGTLPGVRVQDAGLGLPE